MRSNASAILINVPFVRYMMTRSLGNCVSSNSAIVFYLC